MGNQNLRSSVDIQKMERLYKRVKDSELIDVLEEDMKTPVDQFVRSNRRELLLLFSDTLEKKKREGKFPDKLKEKLGVFNTLGGRFLNAAIRGRGVNIHPSTGRAA